MEIKTFIVEGMFCKNCKMHVENGIKNVPGINDVIVDVANGQVRVSGEVIDINQIKGAVEQSGYIYKGEVSITSMNSEQWLS
jgi:copper chaperone CopZ